MGIRRIEDLFVGPHHTVHEVIQCIDRSGRISIALVVDENQQLLATITDGDIRRGILAGIDLQAPASELLRMKADSPRPYPVVAPIGTKPARLLKMMQDLAVRQVPLVAKDGRVAEIVTLADLLPQEDLPLEAVVMAGGLGTRLRPLTDSTPKPMLPIGGRPLLELIIRQLREVGVREVSITTHFHSEKIIDYFGDGHAFGVHLNYVNEERPLGTAGALAVMAQPKQPQLVINGDIVTRVDFRALFGFHKRSRAVMTVGVRRYELKVPYGVFECKGSEVQGFKEKPELSLFINAGIYLLEPHAHSYVPAGERFDMTDLIQKLLNAGEPVVSFPIHEYWLDIGQHTSYDQVQQDVENGCIALR